MVDRPEWSGGWLLWGTHKKFCLQQEGVQGLLVQLLCLEDSGGTEQVLVGRLLSWGHQVAEALLIAAGSTHVQGQGDVGAPPSRVTEEDVSFRHERKAAGQWTAGVGDSRKTDVIRICPQERRALPTPLSAPSHSDPLPPPTPFSFTLTSPLMGRSSSPTI